MAGVIRTEREVLRFENKFVQVYENAVTFSDGSPGTYLRIGPPPGRGPGVVVIPMAQGMIGLVETYRYPVAAVQWGLPRGFGEPGDADPIQSARRELAEEMGTSAKELELLGWLTPDSGMLTTRVAVVVAVLAAPYASPVDVIEVSSVRWVSHEDLWRQVGAGDIEDGFTLSAMSLAAARGYITPPQRP